jgi:hypothetical protein
MRLAHIVKIVAYRRWHYLSCAKGDLGSVQRRFARRVIDGFSYRIGSADPESPVDAMGNLFYGFSDTNYDGSSETL